VRTERLLALAGLILLLSACADGDFGPGEVASFDGGSITLHELDDALLSLSASERPGGDQVVSAEWYEGQIERLFQRKILLSSPAYQGLDGEPEFQRVWSAQRDPLLARAYLQGQAQPAVEEAEVRDYFSQHSNELRRPERRLLYNVFLSIPRGVDETEGSRICAKLEAIRARLLAGESLHSLARQYSESATADGGGLVGIVQRGDLRPALEDVVFGLETGGLSPVIRDGSGCHLLQVAQIQPTIEPNFEALKHSLQQRLGAQARAKWLDEQLIKAAGTLGVALPDWEQTLASDDGSKVLFDVAGQQVTVTDVLDQMKAKRIPSSTALRQEVGDLLFSRVLTQEHPKVAARLLARDRERVGLEYLRRKALQKEMEAVPEPELRDYYDAHKSRYTSDPSVELSLISWPMGSGDPVAVARRAAVFVTDVQQAQGELDRVWSAYAADPGIERSAVPLSNLRTLIKSNPALTRPLLSKFVEGSVLGPFRAGPKVMVAIVEVLVPGRQLSFLEVRDLVLNQYLGSGPSGLEARWAERLRTRFHLRVSHEAVAGFGQRLLNELIPEPHGAGNGPT
jgi:hypothetical protein